MTTPRRWKRYVTAFLMALVMAFLIAPAHAFSSLNGCMKNPACAKMLVEGGVTRSTVAVPSGITTVPGAAAPAARLFTPNLGQAGAVGVAGWLWPWGQDNADELASLYVGDFEGGQSFGVLYNVQVRALVPHFNSNVEGISNIQLYGPIGNIKPTLRTTSTGQSSGVFP